ncbi:restriction endonuclease FokI catalytic domain-containing protein [Bacillus anthracis]|uniref:restriction endonuclease FokI catalytic domain-containing protein n=1 Tax=Bacillus anthracis TaxID=1392 RepID=UPI002DBF52D1|nr:restriction endonuclease FokI catalytic domain-containing protein [Bacillus anthracis]MEB9507345.1 restriction endonuclease FokI catalytic domain-containing protein [Bacillus anthracis]
MKIRTYGWVQNPSSFKSLKKVVQIFDVNSKHYADLKNNLVVNRIYFDDVKKGLLDKLNRNVGEFSYSELVGRNIGDNGKAPKSRSNSVGDSLIQISILPQQTKNTGRKWTDNWTADGFLRWAVSFNFIEVDYKKDTYKISTLGEKFSKTKDDSDDEIEIIRRALLRYPPATQVLSILSEEQTYRTKFYIGDKLGFRGEKGFTSYNEDIMFEWLETAKTNDERKKIKTDIEGTSDKYARGISNWLKNVGFVKSATVYRGPVRKMRIYNVKGFFLTETPILTTLRNS